MHSIAIHNLNLERAERMKNCLTVHKYPANEWQVTLCTDQCDSLRHTLQSKAPDVVVLEISETSDFNWIRTLKTRWPDTEFMACTSSMDARLMNEVLKMGFTGYLLNNELEVLFYQAINEICEGGSPISNKLNRLLIEQLFPKKQRNETNYLTTKELDLLSLISKGFKYKEAADILNVSIHTVNTHLKNTYRKLKVSSKNEAVYEAQQRRSQL